MTLRIGVNNDYIWPTEFREWLSTTYPELYKSIDSRSTLSNHITQWYCEEMKIDNFFTYVSKNSLSGLKQYIIDNEYYHDIWIL